jgi:hypothetical protein
MCYKPYMRKWMRDKLKRRKKSAEETASQPAPLQPAYIESEPQAEEQQPVGRPDAATPASAGTRRQKQKRSLRAEAGASGDANEQGPGRQFSRARAAALEGHRRPCSGLAWIRKELVVQTSQHFSAFERHAAVDSVR